MRKVRNECRLETVTMRSVRAEYVLCSFSPGERDDYIEQAEKQREREREKKINHPDLGAGAVPAQH